MTTDIRTWPCTPRDGRISDSKIFESSILISVTKISEFQIYLSRSLQCLNISWFSLIPTLTFQFFLAQPIVKRGNRFFQERGIWGLWRFKPTAPCRHVRSRPWWRSQKFLDSIVDIINLVVLPGKVPAESRIPFLVQTWQFWVKMMEEWVLLL